MARPASRYPTDGELEILRVLWDRGPLPLSAICAAVREERDVATTTVATMLRLMLDKKLVRRKRAGRTSLWSAALTREKATRSLVGKLVDHVFDGSAQRLVTHLIEADGLTEAEIDELRHMLLRAEPGPVKRRKGTSK